MKKGFRLVRSSVALEPFATNGTKRVRSDAAPACDRDALFLSLCLFLFLAYASLVCSRETKLPCTLNREPASYIWRAIICKRVARAEPHGTRARRTRSRVMNNGCAFLNGCVISVSRSRSSVKIVAEARAVCVRAADVTLGFPLHARSMSAIYLF